MWVVEWILPRKLIWVRMVDDKTGRKRAKKLEVEVVEWNVGWPKVDSGQGW